MSLNLKAFRYLLSHIEQHEIELNEDNYDEFLNDIQQPFGNDFNIETSTDILYALDYNKTFIEEELGGEYRAYYTKEIIEAEFLYVVAYECKKSILEKISCKISD